MFITRKGKELMMPVIDRSSDTVGSHTHSTTSAREHPYNLHRALDRFERSYLHNILVLAGWDIDDAAEMLGIRPNTLSGKMKKYELFSTYHTSWHVSS